MRYLSLPEALDLYARVMAQSGGSAGLRDLRALESALAQPRMAFGDKDLYPTLEEKAVSLCFSIISNHPFVDGNKRLGHAAMETFLLLNGQELSASIDESEQIIIRVASGSCSRDELLRWVREHLIAANG